eukprot:5286525-Alexandrium_andersonii.AAC.1
MTWSSPRPLRPAWPPSSSAPGPSLNWEGGGGASHDSDCGPGEHVPAQRGQEHPRGDEPAPLPPGL